ncbi:hypothetical protein ACIPPQ_14625 [Sphingopyxis sp. LARHCG72]
MARLKPTRADELRRHRAIFEYARRHDLSLIDAEKALVRLAWEAANERLWKVRQCGRRAGRTHAAAVVDAIAEQGRTLGMEFDRPPPADAPWMMRD